MIFLKQPEIDAIVNGHQRLFTGDAGFVKVKLAVAGEVRKARLAGR